MISTSNYCIRTIQFLNYEKAFDKYQNQRTDRMLGAVTIRSLPFFQSNIVPFHRSIPCDPVRPFCNSIHAVRLFCGSPSLFESRPTTFLAPGQVLCLSQPRTPGCISSILCYLAMSCQTSNVVAAWKML